MPEVELVQNRRSLRGETGRRVAIPLVPLLEKRNNAIRPVIVRSEVTKQSIERKTRLPRRQKTAARNDRNGR